MTQRAKKVFWVVLLIFSVVLGLMILLSPHGAPGPAVYDGTMVDPGIGGR